LSNVHSIHSLFKWTKFKMLQHQHQHTHAHTHARTHARTHAHTHTHTSTQIQTNKFKSILKYAGKYYPCP